MPVVLFLSVLSPVTSVYNCLRYFLRTYYSCDNSTQYKSLLFSSFYSVDKLFRQVNCLCTT